MAKQRKINKEQLKQSQRSFFWLTARWVYGLFFMVGGGFLLYSLSQPGSIERSGVLLFLLALYLIFTGLVLISAEHIRRFFILPWFRKAPTAMLLAWFSLPFLVLSILLIINGKINLNTFIGLGAGILFLLLALLLKKKKDK